MHCGDALEVVNSLESNSIHCVVTSPPYFWQRDYGVAGQLGKESTIDGYVEGIRLVMSAVRRVLRQDGTMFLNLGDTYYSGKGEPQGRDRKHPSRRLGLRAVDASGLGPPKKTALGMPWRVALAMIADGWILRAPIIWQRPKAPPEPRVLDRPWRSYETVFLFTKTGRYHFDSEHRYARADVWRIHSQSGGSQHPAAFPIALARRCVELGCPPGGTVLDPFVGSGTTLLAALRNGCDAMGIDLNPDYIAACASRLGALTGGTTRGKRR
jgi:site-specific DNA-methyltransferase (adenine-specific)